jgi:hypothetical protein
MPSQKSSTIPWEALSAVFKYYDASKDEGLVNYLVSREQYANDLTAPTTIVYGPRGCGKTALLVQIEQNYKNRRTCRTQYRSLQRLSDQIVEQGGHLTKSDAARYVIDFWVLLEIAKEFHNKLTVGKNAAIRQTAVKLGLVDGDPIERAATWIKENSEALFQGLATIFGADPALGKAGGKATLALLSDKKVGLLTRINQVSDLLAKHKIMKSLAFQIDEFDSGYSGVRELAQLFEEYAKELFDITNEGDNAPYAVAVSSAIFGARRREGDPPKYVGQVIAVTPWEASELWLLLRKRLEAAVGVDRSSDLGSVAQSLGIDLATAPQAPWRFEAKDEPSLLGALPRPRQFVLLWQKLLAAELTTGIPTERIWKAHLAEATRDAEAFLTAQFNDIIPLLDGLRSHKASIIDQETFKKVRHKALDAAPEGALWITAGIEALMQAFVGAGILAEDPKNTGKFRIRRTILSAPG